MCQGLARRRAGVVSGIEVRFSVLTLLLEVVNCNTTVDGR